MLFWCSRFFGDKYGLVRDHVHFSGKTGARESLSYFYICVIICAKEIPFVLFVKCAEARCVFRVCEKQNKENRHEL